MADATIDPPLILRQLRRKERQASPEFKIKNLAYQRAYRARNRDKVRLRQKAWKQRNPQKVKASSDGWRKRHPERHNSVQAERRRRQQLRRAGRPKPSVCDVCRQPSLKICLDHCHASGKFRGWLCNLCNVALGAALDNPQTLRKLAAYLERAAGKPRKRKNGSVGPLIDLLERTHGQENQEFPSRWGKRQIAPGVRHSD